MVLLDLVSSLGRSGRFYPKLKYLPKLKPKSDPNNYTKIFE